MYINDKTHFITSSGPWSTSKQKEKKKRKGKELPFERLTIPKKDEAPVHNRHRATTFPEPAGGV